MKFHLSLVMALLVPSIGLAGDLEVIASKKKEDSVPTKGNGGNKVQGSESCFYKVNITNKSFKPKPALTARYVIFVERQKLGEKIGSELIEKIRGEAPVKELAGGGKAEFISQSVKLHTSGLIGNYAFFDGGRMKAQDTVKGIWIKFYDGANEVDEFVNPTSLAKKNVWAN